MVWCKRHQKPVFVFFIFTTDILSLSLNICVNTCTVNNNLRSICKIHIFTMKLKLVHFMYILNGKNSFFFSDSTKTIRVIHLKIFIHNVTRFSIKYLQRMANTHYKATFYSQTRSSLNYLSLELEFGLSSRRDWINFCYNNALKCPCSGSHKCPKYRRL